MMLQITIEGEVPNKKIKKMNKINKKKTKDNNHSGTGRTPRLPLLLRSLNINGEDKSCGGILALGEQ